MTETPGRRRLPVWERGALKMTKFGRVTFLDDGKVGVAWSAYLIILDICGQITIGIIGPE
jgi:hypothetical protein